MNAFRPPANRAPVECESRESRRPPPRLWLILAVCGIAFVATSRPASAWGRLGHRASARLAESRLTPTAREAVHALLEPGESFADASTWADEHHREFPRTGPWHYVSVPISEPRYDARFCSKGNCVVAKIDHFRHVLANREAPRDDRQTALRFLIHFVQDVHQPMHVGDHDDRGGNDLQLQFFGRGSNLHRIWDSSLLERADHHEGDWVHMIEADATPEHVERWSKGTVEDWANESLAAARVAYRKPGTRDLLTAGTSLGQEYQELQLPVARERLAQSGVRLAVVLNAIFK